LCDRWTGLLFIGLQRLFLFDSNSANQDKYKQYDEKISKLDTVTEELSARVSHLEFITSKK